MKTMIALCSAVFLLLTSTSAPAKTTEITVHVRSHDAKFVGSAAGGVCVVVKDAESGRVLSQGMIEGGTGDTATLMKEPAERRKPLADKAGKFVAKINIDKPTKVEIAVNGPLSGGQNSHLATKTLIVLPGHDIAGDGVVFELYGCIVHAVSPGPNQMFKSGETVKIEAYVVMLCGCPVTPGGIWDADEFEVTAHVLSSKGDVVKEVPLKYSGATSRFVGEFVPKDLGGYQVWITAAQDEANNFGYAVSGFAVKEAKGASKSASWPNP
jgi:hypothetical protein